MVTQIVFAAALWLVITLVTPGKVRLFISALSSGLIGVLLFFSLISPGALMVYIPGFQGEEGYELTYEEYQALAEPKTADGVIVIPNIDALKALDLDILAAKHLSADQLKALEGAAGYQDFAAGKTGMVIRYIAPSVKAGKLSEGYDAVEFAPLPYYEDLVSAKKEIVTKVKQLRNTQEELSNNKRELKQTQKTLEVNKVHLNRKQEVLNAIRQVVEGKDSSQI
jgi:hypothetical protein